MNYSLQELIERLVSFRSTSNHPAEMQNCFEFVKAYLIESGLHVNIYVSNNVLSLVAAKKIKKHYKYILNGHLDVVPAEYPDAFKAIKKGDRLYARGASDMKGTVAVMIKLIKDLYKTDSDVALILTSDEEVGGEKGVNYLLNEKNYSCDCAIIPDGGNNFHLTLKQKGILHIKILARGIAAHGSRPWMGDNAIDKLLVTYSSIQKKFPLHSNKNNWQTTLNLGKFQGGSATNMVADEAEMFLDFRYVKESDKNKFLKLMEKLSQKDTTIRYELLTKGDIMSVPLKNNYIQKIITLAKRQGLKLIPEKSNTASDARYFTAKNIPVVMINPLCSQGHIDNEWVDLKSLGDYFILLKNFITGD